jgi:hypothetical protein
VTAGAAYSLAIAQVGTPVTLLDFSGYCNGSAATNYYLMFFAQSTVPANGTQPLYKQQILGADGFKFGYMPKGFHSAELMALSQAVQQPNMGGLIAVLSTTPETLTIATGTVTMDLDVFIEEYESLQPNTTIVGDLTTAVASLQVWSEASGQGVNNLAGQKQLLRVWYINKSASTQYLQLFAQDNPATNSATLGVNVTIPSSGNGTVGGSYTQSSQVNSQLVPIMQWSVPTAVATSGTLVIGGIYKITTFVAGDNFTNVGAGANVTNNVFVATGTTPTTWSNGSTVTALAIPLTFGISDSGLDPFSIDAGKTTFRIGCSLFASTTSGYLTAASANWCIRAQYK